MNGRHRTATLGLALLVVAACALALTPLRSPLVVPAVVGVAGWAATRLVLGPRGDGNGGGADGLLRATLPVVLGMLALLGSVLLIAGLGWRIDTPGIVAGAGFVTLVLLVAAGAVGAKGRDTAAAEPQQGDTAATQSEQGHPAATAAPSATATPTRRGRRAVRAGAGVAGAVLVLAAGVSGAIALQPAPVQRYAQIALDSAVAVSGEPVTARPAEVVTLDWTRSGYGGPLAAASRVTVTVGGDPARDLVVDTSPPAPAPSDAVDVQPGSVAFRAPATEGLYPVRITVDGSELVATLKVAR
jgi:hypothetical protein